jgi:hypothetical protein
MGNTLEPVVTKEIFLKSFSFPASSPPKLKRKPMRNTLEPVATKEK